MKRYVLAIDQGTTSSRALLFDRTGRTHAVAQQEFPQHFPRPGWVEHDPVDLWQSTRQVIRRVLRESGVVRQEIAAVGLTNQRETTLLWERKTGRALHPAIVWQDRRTAEMCARLRQKGGEALIRRRTGLLPDPYFSGTKLAWLLDHLPRARQRARRGELAFGTVDSWLLWHLTSGASHATDVTNASRTLLLNLHSGKWDPVMLRRLRIPSAVLPEVRPSSGIFGEVTALPELRGVPIAGIAGDQQAALFGQACFQPGMAKNTYGTGCFLLLHTGRKPIQSRHRLLTTIAWQLGKDQPLEYALEGSVFIGGAVVQWLRDGLGLIRHSRDVEALARQVPDNGGVYLVPAFAGLGAPYWDSTARGVIVGLTRGSTRAHLARAAVESIALQSADLLGAMEADSGRKLRELRVDGGASLNSNLMQLQADLLQVPVIRPRNSETTAQGAAFLAGLAVGFWPDRAAIAAHWKRERVFRPKSRPAAMRSLQSGWQRAVERARNWTP